MAENHDQHGQHGLAKHSTGGAGAWIDKHMGGAVMSFGARAETVFEGTMFLIVNGFMRRAGIAFLAIMAPVILVELILHTLRF